MYKKILIFFLIFSFCTEENLNSVNDDQSNEDSSLWCVVAFEKIGQTYENPIKHPKTETSINLEKEFDIAAQVYKKQNGITGFLVFEKDWNISQEDFNKFGKQIGIEPFSQKDIDKPGGAHITYYFHQFLTLENNKVSLEICDIWYSTTSYKQFPVFTVVDDY